MCLLIISLICSPHNHSPASSLSLHAFGISHLFLFTTSSISSSRGFFLKPIKHNDMINKNILAYFQQGSRLTVNKALRLFHTTELRKVVSRLRRQGHDIRSTRLTDATLDGRKVYFNEYYLHYEN